MLPARVGRGMFALDIDPNIFPYSLSFLESVIPLLG